MSINFLLSIPEAEAVRYAHNGVIYSVYRYGGKFSVFHLVDGDIISDIHCAYFRKVLEFFNQ